MTDNGEINKVAGRGKNIFFFPREVGRPVIVYRFKNVDHYLVWGKGKKISFHELSLYVSRINY
jgi:hypothetical protein